jgi:MATE family, multidrug efflux pump
MKDLTQGPIFRNLIAMALPIAVGMLLQALYYFVDLYFVARLGGAALAGVSAAGNAFFVVLALTQMLGVGAVALISQAVGRNDSADANHVFNQSIVLSAVCAGVTLLGGYGLGSLYMRALAADAATTQAGTTFLYWFLPGLALQFALVVMGSALRGTGIVKPTMVVQALTVVLNTILAPVLIAGWGTGHPLGVAGAGLASSVATGVGVILLALYFLRLEHYVQFDRAQIRPRFATWARMLNVGLPAGGEFALMAIYVAMVYWIIRDFGAAAQAGFGVGMRIMQMIFLPAMALAFAAAPIAGQNFGAQRYSRVRETFRVTAVATCSVMLVLTLICQWRSEVMVHGFTADPSVIAFGADYLRIISWNFIAAGLVFSASSIFQGLGNTWPSLVSSSSRLVLFLAPALWLAAQPAFQLVEVWYLSVATNALQAIFSLLLVQREFRVRLGAANSGAGPEPVRASAN